MEKKYTKPTVIKVELTQEQAVLGVCASGVTKIADSNPGGLCDTAKGGCKQRDNAGGSAASS